MAAAVYRAALLETSRTRLLEVVKDNRRKERLERALEHQDAIDLALTLIRFAAEIWFVLALNQSSLNFGLAGSLERHGATFVLSILWLYPTVHILPRKFIAHQPAEAVLRPMLMLLYWLSFPCYPLAQLLQPRRSRVEGQSDAGEIVEEMKVQITDEIIDVVEEGERSGALEESEVQMIENVLTIQDLHVSEVMTPRTDLTCIEVTKTLEEACRVAHEDGHSKIPVFRENRDQICGIFQLRDAIPELTSSNGGAPSLESIMRPAYFVPETKRVVQLLREFQAEKLSFAIVLDEYGGTAGVITVEDILEEIVGEIREEHDLEDTTPIRRVGKDTFSLDPRLRIEEANEELNIHLPPSEDYDTVGGFVFSHLDRIPDSGEVFVYDGLEFLIEGVNSRRIERLRLRALHRD